MKGFLSTVFLSVALFASLPSEAQTLREKRIKEEMLTRVDALTVKLNLVRKDLASESVADACTKLKEVFDLYPDHVKDVGVRLDAFDNKCAEIRNDALTELITLHREVVTCGRGRGNEYVDPDRLSDTLKDIVKSLKNQRKIIAKKSVEFQNNFHYDYEF